MDKKKRILVVDDDEAWLFTIGDILESDYDLTMITEHSKADELVKKNSYDLIILDKRLAEVSGLEVLSRLRRAVPDLHAIMLTGYPDVDSAVDSMKLGALDYISKGTEELPNELRTRVKEALEKRESLDRDYVTALIRQGESSELEFKSSARWDVRANKANKELEKVIVKTVAAFLNSETGGTLLIGVDDIGVILGLDDDYRTLGKKKDRDGFETFLTSILLDAFGRESSPLIRMTFHRAEDKDVCQVSVKASPKPVFVAYDKGEHLFIRAGNSTRLLSTREALEYCKIRWK